jgi:hypothetical protein
VKVDLAAFCLRWAVRTLPDRQAEWGDGMCAELVGLVDRAERRRFAIGCTMALARRPAFVLAVLRWSVRLSLLVAAVALAWAIDVPLTRLEALAVIVAFVVGLTLLRSRVGFGPVAAGRSARLVATSGALTAAVEVMLELRRLRVDPPLKLPVDATVGVFDPARAGADLIRMTLVLGILLVGLARVSASRTAVRPTALASAAAAGGVAAGAWVLAVLIYPATASSALPGLLAAGAAVLLAVALVHGVEARRGRLASSSRRSPGVIAGLLSVVGSMALIGLFMDLLPLTGRWVADSAAPLLAAHPPARVTDPVAIWLVCLLASVAVVVVVRRPLTATPTR